ncbi:hypothetical protein CYMTET_29330 [Cymbomonas tetramitiformis]|uniref:Tyrosine-protein kinase ephrin type A/B receptor-like domain-containing protein n=1 Tax=Cymbomonas tetramitiformis TaxID=36881 RepID=A0AAE0FLM9_9CHLO|nr:hypothetical protein CYMTET_29330 [Cymbomonas tetramitiformis]
MVSGVSAVDPRVLDGVAPLIPAAGGCVAADPRSLQGVAPLIPAVWSLQGVAPLIPALWRVAPLIRGWDGVAPLISQFAEILEWQQAKGRVQLLDNGYSGFTGLFAGNWSFPGRQAAHWDFWREYTDWHNSELLTQHDVSSGTLNLSSGEALQLQRCDKPYCHLGAFYPQPQCPYDEVSGHTRCHDCFLTNHDWDSGWYEALLQNLGLPLKAVYLGSQDNLQSLLLDLQHRRLPVLFYWYSPDPLLTKLSAIQVLFPDTGQCQGMHHPDPDLSGVSCAKSSETLQKVVWQASAQGALSSARRFVEDFQLPPGDMEGMMGFHVDGGGLHLNAWDAACSYLLQAQPLQARLQALVEANPMMCVNGYMAADGTCKFCAEGEIQQDFVCVPCAPGTFKTTSQEGLDVCSPCEPGSMQHLGGSSECIPCAPGSCAPSLHARLAPHGTVLGA